MKNSQGNTIVWREKIVTSHYKKVLLSQVRCTKKRERNLLLNFVLGKVGAFNKKNTGESLNSQTREDKHRFIFLPQ